MKTAWKNQQVLTESQQAIGIFIPKDQNSYHQPVQKHCFAEHREEDFLFHQRRMTNFLMANKYIDTSCQKAGIPGFPSCIEYSSMIWDQMQQAKREKHDPHVVWLDLANAYGSVPHTLIDFSLDFFHVPECIKNIIARYFSNLHMCFAVEGCMTGWQRLERGFAMDVPSPPSFS